MITAPWLDKLELISLRDSLIVGVLVDVGVSVHISPVDPGTVLNKKLAVLLRHLGSGASRTEFTTVPIADPKFFEVIKDMVERMRNE